MVYWFRRKTLTFKNKALIIIIGSTNFNIYLNSREVKLFKLGVDIYKNNIDTYISGLFITKDQSNYTIINTSIMPVLTLQQHITKQIK
jgi:hypothetical protein